MTAWDYLKYFIIGLVQGITEPLPVSSSAHMLIFGKILNLNNIDVYFETIIHFASSLAILLFMGKDVLILIKNVIIGNKNNHSKETQFNRSYFIKLVIASIPAGLVGIFFSDFIDEHFMNYYVACFCLLVTALLLLYASAILRKNQTNKEKPTIFDAFLIGIFQMIALIPGISRSGSTVTAGLNRELHLKDALKFSFFLYLIASFGALLLTIYKVEWSTINIPYAITAFIGAFIATSIAIRWFFQKLNAKNFIYFAIYCIIIGSVGFFF